MFDFLTLPVPLPELFTTLILICVCVVVAAMMISHAIERAERAFEVSMPPDTDHSSGHGFWHPAMNNPDRNTQMADGIRNAIQRSADREAAILGAGPGRFVILDEDGDVDTVPPLDADQKALLRKIDRVEQDTWSALWAEKNRAKAALQGFPISLIGRGVSIPQAHHGELL